MSRLWVYLRRWAKYNLLTFPVIAAIYVPYNVLWIGYTPLQLAKWLLTAAIFGACANLAIQPWIRLIHRRGWVE